MSNNEQHRGMTPEQFAQARDEGLEFLNSATVVFEDRRGEAQLMNEHTPGPWSLSTEGNPSPLLTRITGGSQLICVTDSANARLIAAAPDLLALLAEVTEAIEAYADDHNSDRPTDVTVLLPRLRRALER